MFPPWWPRRSFPPLVATNCRSNHCQVMAFLSKWPPGSVTSPTTSSCTSTSQASHWRREEVHTPVLRAALAPYPPRTPPHCQPPFMLPPVIQYFGHPLASMSLLRAASSTQASGTSTTIHQLSAEIRARWLMWKRMKIWWWLWPNFWECPQIAAVKVRRGMRLRLRAKVMA